MTYKSQRFFIRREENKHNFMAFSQQKTLIYIGLEFVATDALTTLQQYFCGDGLKLTERSVFYIMKLVGILKQDQLVPQCVDFIVKRLLRPKTVFGLKAAFDDVPLLVDKAIKYAQVFSLGPLKFSKIYYILSSACAEFRPG